MTTLHNNLEAVLTTIDALPNGLAGLKIVVHALDDYVVDALDSEDVAVLENTSPKERIEDFLRYFAILHNVNLLDIMNAVDIEKES